jgi:hypothetical protein
VADSEEQLNDSQMNEMSENACSWYQRARDFVTKKLKPTSCNDDDVRWGKTWREKVKN